MINDIINITSHLSVCIPLITSIVFYKKIPHKFYPFLYFIFLVGGYDLLWFLIDNTIPKYGTLFFNFYVLTESLVFLQIYRRWGLFKKIKGQYIILIVSFISIWITEAFWFLNLKHDNYYFVLFYAVVEAFLTIKMINERILNLDKPLHIDPVFFICTGFMVYSSTSILIGIFSLSFFKTSLLFRWHLVNIADVSVTIMYLIFAYSIVLIARMQPKRSDKLLDKRVIKNKGTQEKSLGVEYKSCHSTNTKAAH